MCHRCVSTVLMKSHPWKCLQNHTSSIFYISPFHYNKTSFPCTTCLACKFQLYWKIAMSHRDNISLNSYLNKNIYNQLTHCGKADSCFRLVLKCFEFPTHRNRVFMRPNPHNPRYAGDKRCDSSTQICGRSRRDETFLLRGQPQLLLPIVCNLSIVSFKNFKNYLSGWLCSYRCK